MSYFRNLVEKSISEKETHYIIALRLLFEATGLARRSFFIVWTNHTNKKWTDVEEDNIDLINILNANINKKKFNAKFRSNTNKYLRNGDSKEWDISVLGYIFDSLPFRKTIYAKSVLEIKQVRNKLHHAPNINRMSKLELRTHCDNLKKSSHMLMINIEKEIRTKLIKTSELTDDDQIYSNTEIIRYLHNNKTEFDEMPIIFPSYVCRPVGEPIKILNKNLAPAIRVKSAKSKIKSVAKYSLCTLI